MTVLKEYFGHTGFRRGQEELIDALLAGRDVLGVMPTGAGKSMCYQIPALLFPGLTVVVSPLISLMNDQVAALTLAGISAGCIHSGQTPEEYGETVRLVRRGTCKLLYIAPERLDSQWFSSFLDQLEISFLAVDEAHCVSQWGQDFRPSYLKIAEFSRHLPTRPVMGAFTATATQQVKIDIQRMLGLSQPVCVATGFDRENLFFDVVTPKHKGAYLMEYLGDNKERSGIIYCVTRRGVEAVWAALKKSGFSVTRYHAGLEDEERSRNQEDFVYDRKKIMVATNAFGMGIDKSNVNFVFHYNMPKNLESYYQEAGRAGRDGARAECVLLFGEGDVQTAKYMIQQGGEEENAPGRTEIIARELRRLEHMVGFCKTKGCLRTYFLRYFGEDREEPCGNCGNCTSEYGSLDITVEAQKILSGVARVEKRFPCSLGQAMILQMLVGANTQRVRELGLDRLPTHGVLKGTDRRQVREIMDYLLYEGYLSVSPGEYPVLRIASRARGVLFQGEQVAMPVRQQPVKETAQGKQKKKEGSAAPREKEPAAVGESTAFPLLAVLKEVRTQLAQEAKVPAYIVFSNATLEDMVRRHPRTMEEFLEVSGVGEVKAQRYAQAFLNAILTFDQERTQE